MSYKQYEIYGKSGEKFILDFSSVENERDYHDSLKQLGYYQQNIGEPCFYVDSDMPFLELLRFYKKDSGSIIALWDHNSSVFEFYCEDPNAELDLICKLTTMMKDLVSCEYMLYKIYKQREENGE